VARLSGTPLGTRMPAPSPPGETYIECVPPCQGRRGPGVGHTPQLEAPGLVTGTLRDWLGRHFAPAAG
jgi:pimeloyl-ACP methyl ester carboxylesterase